MMITLCIWKRTETCRVFRISDLNCQALRPLTKVLLPPQPILLLGKTLMALILSETNLEMTTIGQTCSRMQIKTLGLLRMEMFRINRTSQHPALNRRVFPFSTTLINSPSKTKVPITLLEVNLFLTQALIPHQPLESITTAISMVATLRAVKITLTKFRNRIQARLT